jgi:3-dehydroquinate synthase
MPDQGPTVHFAVPCVHRLRFTRDVLGLAGGSLGQDSEQHVLAEVLEPSEGRPARVQFWLDENVAAALPELRQRLHRFTASHADRLIQAGNVQLVPGGEAIKNDIHILERMLKVFNAADLDRRSYVVVIGGGAVLDAVGFAAAIAHRGLRLVRLPTTTLGQADSGLGVKNGVNLFGKKNWLGSFAVPWAVVNDAALLSTLSDRDWICGFSESVKVSLLKDAALFDELCRVAPRIRRRDPEVSLPMIRASAELHLAHITRGGDPFEMLEARPLDFGHWSAHKLEALSNFEVRHGEAVAIGVAIDTVYSSLKFGLPTEDAERALSCLAALGFQLSHPALLDGALFDGLEEFRQHLGGRLTLTMVPQVGRAIDVHEVDRHKMREAIGRVVEIAETREAATAAL